jgi:glycosyltransferase involved in cell wall biosynthesis
MPATHSGGKVRGKANHVREESAGRLRCLGRVRSCGDVRCKLVRIVVACCWPPDRGQGISTAAKEVAVALRLAGHEVVYLSPRASDLSWYLANDIEQLFIGPDLDPRSGVLRVVAALRYAKPDLLINNDHPFVQAALPRVDCRSIVICHAVRWGTRALATVNHEWADHIVAISVDMYNSLARAGVPVAKLALIYNGVADPIAATRDYESAPGSALRVVFAGNWTRVKGGDLILAAVSNAPAWAQDIHLDCFGDGVLLRAAKRRETAWFRVHGRVLPSVFRDYLRDADVLLAPSRIEGCPMAVIEAMGSGVVPVVSDGLGAMRWMVDTGIDGYIVSRSAWRRDQWRVLESLKDDQKMTRRMGDRARERFQRQFSVEQVVERLVSLTERGRSARSAQPRSLTALRWHRPVGTSSPGMRLADRLAYRYGVIRTAGSVSV